jgi:Domain of unknown function (DUF4190)
MSSTPQSSGWSDPTGQPAPPSYPPPDYQSTPTAPPDFPPGSGEIRPVYQAAGQEPATNPAGTRATDTSGNPASGPPGWPASPPASSGPYPPPPGYPTTAVPGYPSAGYPATGYPATPGAGYPTSGEAYGNASQYPAAGQGYPAGGYATPAYPSAGYAGYGGGYPGYAPYPIAQKTNGLAIAAMVVSITAIPLLFCYLAGGLVGIAGAIMGHVARRQLRERNEGGSGMALAAIITGWIATALAVLLLVLVIIGFALIGSSTGAGSQ